MSLLDDLKSPEDVDIRSTNPMTQAKAGAWDFARPLPFIRGIMERNYPDSLADLESIPPPTTLSASLGRAAGQQIPNLAAALPVLNAVGKIPLIAKFGTLGKAAVG